jgi:hypothetical protein
MEYCHFCTSEVNIITIGHSTHCKVCIDTRCCSACEDFFDDEEIFTIKVKGKPALFCYNCKKERDREQHIDCMEYQSYREQFE